MIDTISLKTSLIDLAVSGRLSTEFQAEDSVSEIIEKLPTPSNKRKKLLGQAFEYGKQSDIPENWRWMPLGEITSYGDTPVKANTSHVSDDTWILDLEDIKAGGELLTKTRANEKQFAGEKTVFHSGQVLYSKLRPYLKKVLVADEDGISTPELISFDVFGGILPQYIVCCLLDSFTNRAIDKRSYGIKMPRIDAGFMVNLPLPVPPISEQNFIINRLETAFSLIDTIESLQLEYASNHEKLKSKLIDAAIQGKLTKQLPEDGFAEELYQQIQGEKKKLEKEGKIKKEKKAPAINKDELPFEIPSTWKWVRLSEIGLLQTGTTPSKSNPNYFGDDIPFLSPGEIQDNVITRYDKQGLSESGAAVARVVEKDSVLQVCIGGSIGKAAINDRAITFNQQINSVTPYIMNHEYIFYCLTSNYFISRITMASAGAATPIINKTNWGNLVIPLAPLAEQDRIVEKLNGLFVNLSE